MAKKRRGRCVKKNKQLTSIEPEHLTRAPHSFIFHRGTVGKYVLSLVKDFRKIVEPFTATNLKARRKNSLKDFVSVSGLLHVSHMMIFTCSPESPYMRLVRLPRGPTLTFKIHEYVLARDVASSLKKQYSHPRLYQTAPLLIMNGFSGESSQLKLMVASFQSMFPVLNISKVNLNEVHRCLLLNYNSETNMIDIRHYMIRVTPVGVSKSVKKLLSSKVPNLSRFSDISDFIEKADVLSESEGEDDPNSHVELPQEIRSRGNIVGNTSAIRLSELGPRLTIQLLKVETGLMDGEVLYHEYIHKTEEEKAEILRRREETKKLKLKRKQQQTENVKKKEALKEELKKKSLEGMRKKKENEVEIEKEKSDPKMNPTVEDGNLDEDDDAEWYRKEVGKEPEPELFQNKPKSALKRKSDYPHNTWRSKKMKKEGAKSVKWRDQQDEKRAKYSNFKNNKSIRREVFKKGNKKKQPINQPIRKRKLGSRVSKDGRRY
uniref:Putative rna-binding protein n=1 Tax=Panstrongylus megistus TaxID=65343 RepID=A0A069DU24_9HEMI